MKFPIWKNYPEKWMKFPIWKNYPEKRMKFPKRKYYPEKMDEISIKEILSGKNLH